MNENQAQEGDNDIQEEGEWLSGVADAAQSSRYVTVREYYCFKLQVRQGLFNSVIWRTSFPAMVYPA
jgi:hypothetical protein